MGDSVDRMFKAALVGAHLRDHQRFQPTEGTMNFGQAIEAIKAGQNAARAGWNGKGMFIFLNEGSFDHNVTMAVDETMVEGIPLHLFRRGDKGTSTRLPNINMRAASGSTVTGWLASQTDLLAEDWEIAHP